MVACPLEGLVSCSPLSPEARVLHEEGLPRLKTHLLLASEFQNQLQPLPKNLDHLVMHREERDTKPEAPRWNFNLRDRRSDCLQ